MAFVSLDDQTGRADVSVFGELYAQARRMAQEESLLVISGTCGIDERTGELQIRAEQVDTISSLRGKFLKRITIAINEEDKQESLLSDLSEVCLDSASPGTNVDIRYTNSQGDAITISLSNKWKVDASDKVVEELYRIFGKSSVLLNYQSERSLRSCDET